jgi:hypothetical protein
MGQRAPRLPVPVPASALVTRDKARRLRLASLSMSTPAGWYPVDDHERYWDGTAWTAQIRDASPVAPPAPVASAIPHSVAPSPSKGDDLRPDIAAAIAKMATKIGGKREIRKLPDHLWEGETVSWIATGAYGGGMGIIVLTDRRLFFLKDGMMRQTSEDFVLSKLSSIQWSSGMLMGKIQVFVSGNKSEIENVSKAEGKAIVDQVRGIIAGGGSPTPASDVAVRSALPVEAAPDPIAQLEKLGALRDAGILTEDEFSAKKAEILSRM